MASVQRIGAYGICRDPARRVLLVRASSRTGVAGRWFLPGGGLEHGEAPFDAFARELDEETGLALGAARLLGVLSEARVLDDGTALHMIRIVYLVERWTGTVRAEVTGTSDAVVWVPPGELGELDTLPYVDAALALETDDQTRSSIEAGEREPAQRDDPLRVRTGRSVP
jgi:8-oxo-dGTP diphosphatase